MRSACALLALAGLSQAKVFLFNAENCNTNFDNYKNYDFPSRSVNSAVDLEDMWTGDKAPKNVAFTTENDAEKPIAVRVNSGAYVMQRLTLQNNMKIMFDVEGVEMGFDSSASGPEIFFKSGADTTNPGCSLGCHNNFFEFLGRDQEAAADVDLREANTDLWNTTTGEWKTGEPDDPIDAGYEAVPAARTPCDTDTVIIPKRYGVNLLSLGFHPFKELVYAHSDEELVTVTDAADLPAFMMFPTSNQKVFLGQNVLDDCADHGVLDDQDRCICISECPAREDAVSESNRLRDAAKLFAQRELKSYNKAGNRESFDWTYGYAFEPNSITGYPCDLSSRAVTEGIEKYSGGHLGADAISITIDEERATISASGRLNGRAGDFEGQVMKLKNPIKILDSYEPYGSGAVAEYEMDDVKDHTNMQLAMTVYHAIVDEMQKECKLRGSTDLLDAAGVTFVKGERTIVYAGSNLPQIDVNQMVNENNKAGIVEHVFDQIKSIQGFEQLSKDALYGSWKLQSPEDRTKGRRSNRLGLATDLIMVNLEYSRWSTGSGVDKRHVERVTNHMLATYDVLTHHKCFTFDGGFDEECIGNLVAGAVQSELGLCPQDKARECFDAAKKTALAITTTIKGCGLLGSVPIEASSETKCADPEEQAHRAEESEAYAAKVTEFETAAAEQRHADALEAARVAAEAARVKLAGEISDAGIARNASLGAREQEIKAKLAEAKSDALEIAAANDNLDQPVEDAKAATKVRTDEETAASLAVDECINAKVEDRGGDDDCSNAEDALLDATEAKRIAKEKEYTLRKLQLQLLKQISEGDGLQGPDLLKLDEIVAEIEDELLATETALAQAEQDQKEAKQKMVDNDCNNREETHKPNCAALGLAEATLRNKVAQLKAEQADTREALDSATEAQGSAKSAVEPGFFDEMLNVVLVAAGVIILLIVGVGAVLVMGGGGGGGGGGGSQQNWDNDRSVVAFENPMYDDPNAGAARAPSMKRSASKKKAAAAAAEADDGGGLYDEPAFNDEEPAAGGGYLDVEPDDDDDESEEEEEESSEEEESDDDDE